MLPYIFNAIPSPRFGLGTCFFHYGALSKIMADASDEPDEDMKATLKIWRDSIKNTRPYASYFDFKPNRGSPEDKALMERQVAACLLAYLDSIEDWTGAKIYSSEKDPPDCHGTVEGRKFGIEVTELVDEKMILGHSQRERAAEKGVSAPSKAVEPGDVAVWTALSLHEKLSFIVRRKDKEAVDGPFIPYMVVIHTDETMVTPQLVQEAIEGMALETRHIDRAYLLLSYDPRAGNFPNHLPVFRLPLVKKI